MSPVTDTTRSLRRVLAVAGTVLVVTAVTVVLVGRASLGASSEAPTTTTPASAGTAAISRGDLSNEDDFTGTVGYGDEWALPLQAGGIVTAHPEEGAVIEFGEELVRVDEQPVILAKGEVPMYRELARTSPRMSGVDVEQLQRFLISQGFDDDGALEVDGEFGYTTKNAVEDWQESLGVEETGRVSTARLVFSPTPLRIATETRVGAAFSGLEVTEAAPVVTVDTSSSDRDLLPVGNRVTVELADGTEMTGVISDQSRVLLSDGSAVWRTTVDLEARPPSDASSVVVHSAVTVEEDVLIVPVSALLALAEGGFALEVVDGSSTHLVAVEVGTVIGGLAQVSGEVDAGDVVVVAA